MHKVLTTSRLRLISGLLLIAITMLAPRGAAQTFTTIYNFNASPDGRYPLAGLTLAPGGVLFGATDAGGTGCPSGGGRGCGTVFQLNPPALGGTWSDAVLHSFGSHSGDGKYPQDTL